LDGETDWKLRKAVRFTQEKNDPDSIHALGGTITAEAPTNLIDKFQGTFESRESEYKEGLELQNTLWANTVLAS